MKTLGIVGGVGPESTIDYYRAIIAEFRRRTDDAGYPHLVIVSLDVDEGIRMLNANELPQLAEYLTGGVRQLAKAGADFALIAANSPHIVFDEVRQASPIPLLSIVEATCEEVRRRGVSRVGLLGTRFTMSGSFYPEAAARFGLTLVSPTEAEQAQIHQKYIQELLLGKFLPETREILHGVVETLKQRDGIQAVVLAGTELPLILRAESIAELPLFDTTLIHVNAAVSEIMND